METFEKQWLQKLKTGLKQVGKEALYDKMVPGEAETMLSHLHKIMRILRASLSQSQLEEVMSSCACLASKDYLQILRDEYTRSGDLKKVHYLLQHYFEEFICKYKNLSKSQLQYIKDNAMGMAGTLKGSVVIAVKIPRDFHEYFQTENEAEKRFHYCHCPRIRKEFLAGREIVDADYCYCGAGFYRDIWEFILQKPIKVELTESLLKGDDVCKIKIKL